MELRQVQALFDQALTAGANPNRVFASAIFRAIKGWKRKTRSPLIDQYDFVFLMQGRSEPESQIGRSWVARSAGQMEDGRIPRLRLGRYAKDKKIDPALRARRLTILRHQCSTAADSRFHRAGVGKQTLGASHGCNFDRGFQRACGRQEPQEQQTQAASTHKRSLLGQRQDSRSRFRDRDRMLKVGGQRAVLRNDGPAIVQLHQIGPPRN